MKFENEVFSEWNPGNGKSPKNPTITDTTSKRLGLNLHSEHNPFEVSFIFLAISEIFQRLKLS